MECGDQTGGRDRGQIDTQRDSMQGLDKEAGGELLGCRVALGPRIQWNC